MNIAQAGEPALRKRIRVWPGVVAVVLEWVLMFGVPRVAPDLLLYGMFGSLGAALAVLVWWSFFSRAPWLERLSVIVLIIAAAAVTSRFIDKSIAGGMMGYMFPFFSIPVFSLALVAGAVAGHRLSTWPRRTAIAASVLLACVGCTLVRTNGISGEGMSDLAWRWSKTHEERLVTQAGGKLSALPAAPPTTPTAVPEAANVPAEQPVVRHAKQQPVALPPTRVAAKTEAEWPGFRGPGRDSIIPGTRIETDWSASRPVELWRRPIGPGWGSFAVSGNFIYTQEQRGDEEIVACYDATTGNPVWAHRDATRFWESNAGPGPRATPTLHDGRAYTFGATGIVNALAADNGAVLWSRNAASDTGMKTPGWGFASSPLVADDMVIVAASGRLVAYDLATGTPRWFGPKGGDSYSSPHLATIDGVRQILLMSAAGATSVAPDDGKVLWKYAWPSDTRIMQPAVTADGGLLITAGDAMGGVGIRRIAVAHGSGGWTTEERWTSNGLKPSFNDSVVYDGYVYGFDGSILACIDANDGKRKWKGGRYGAGQLVLLRDQGLLVVLSEEGEVALVKAAPDQFTELARIPAIEGKTWNHPVLAGDRLLVRNGNEMVAFRLALAHR